MLQYGYSYNEFISDNSDVIASKTRRLYLYLIEIYLKSWYFELDAFCNAHV